ncbi:MAG: UTP--glucose-1-phosphate uridylyltransferase [Armatimonadetes bacterium]|nr:UTP--glucose-1-phosphate uridylyltransferase [Armatimonadota bacterium]
MSTSSRLVDIICADDADLRNTTLERACAGMSIQELLSEAAALEAYRRREPNLYQRVRACFFLYAVHRFHLPATPALPPGGPLPYEGVLHVLGRRFEEAIQHFLSAMRRDGPSDGLSSALAVAYHRLGFQTLADQVRRSVRSVPGNQWMFRTGHPQDHPLRIRPEMLHRALDGGFPILRERTPVRMDLSHSGWSDIFFLGMDYPEGARVLNISIDLAVHGRDPKPTPPVQAFLRVIDEPIIRLASIDLSVDRAITGLGEMFDFARDYLGLLKAALIASGVVPPGIEGSGHSLKDLLATVVGPGHGLELVSSVNDIPKGSRLAVSTNLLASLIAACMRATGQTAQLTGALDERERRTVAARAILGEWLAGSGGGWQDSGGVWPGIKLITGQVPQPGDPEHGVSRGTLLPGHRVLDEEAVSAEARRCLEQSLVLVHGGMAQNVGPILEMVTEKYLLRSEAEWLARQEASGVFDAIVAALQAGDVEQIGALTTRNFTGPLQTIIPWASNQYTETLITDARAAFGSDFMGFWMLGGMSGGGMGFLFRPEARARAMDEMQTVMSSAKRRLATGLPFAMEPVVYDFAINEAGTFADLMEEATAVMPPGYYALSVPNLVRGSDLPDTDARQADLDRFGRACRDRADMAALVPELFHRLLPRRSHAGEANGALDDLLREAGFDAEEHEAIREDLRVGRIGLAQNRLPVNSRITDVRPEDTQATTDCTPEMAERADAALRNGEVAIVTLAAGVGSRWTQGAGVVKALHPYAKLSGKHRTFIETHIAKARRAARSYGVPPLHVVTTSYLTHAAIGDRLAAEGDYGSPAPIILSPGRSIGLRMAPMERDLRFQYEGMHHQVLDAQAQKVREGAQAAMIEWARSAPEGSDYRDNVPAQCAHPVGHWYEVPNLLKNGVLLELLRQRPQTRYLMLHNIDTLGAELSPQALGLHMQQDAALTFEVITRRIDDRGGGLARVDGRPRLVEGLAMPREECEFALTYYNSLTTWISVDALLSLFGLDAAGLADTQRVTDAVRAVAARMPTYITLKDVKRRWGHGQEDVLTVVQFEKLWGDMAALPELECRYIAAPRMRGQQLKDQAQLDGWLRDGSAAYIDSRCDWAD